jgi:urease accessory protein UreF
MHELNPTALPDFRMLAGDCVSLAGQLGSTMDLVTLEEAASRLKLRRVESPADLDTFLRDYLDQVLLPIEFPLIQEAFERAQRNELRELIAIDQQLARDRRMTPFAESSRRIGRARLRRLRPLRDHRLVQRYVKALDEGTVQGWHTLVYGVTLAVYSLPLQQGLLHYAQQTLHGFTLAAAVARGFSETECRQVLERVFEHLSQLLDQQWSREQPPPLRVE